MIGDSANDVLAARAAGKKVVASIVGLIAGLVVGLVGGLFLFDFGDDLLVSIVGGALGGIVAGWVWPTPFLAVGGIVLSIFTANS